jgi:hypothetical protein
LDIAPSDVEGICRSFPVLIWGADATCWKSCTSLSRRASQEYDLPHILDLAILAMLAAQFQEAMVRSHPTGSARCHFLNLQLHGRVLEDHRAAKSAVDVDNGQLRLVLYLKALPLRC